MAKDKLIFNLNCHMTKLSETLGLCSNGEAIHKVSLGLGSKEDPFELEVKEVETLDDCPQGSLPEDEEATGSGYNGDVGLIVPCSEGDRREAEEADVFMEESLGRRVEGIYLQLLRLWKSAWLHCPVFLWFL